MHSSKILKSVLLGAPIFSLSLLATESAPSVPDVKFTASTLSSPQSITLKSGWNLISIPGYESQSITSLFESSKIKNVWSYGENGWNLYEPNIRNEISSIDPSKGYWVYVNSGESYTISINTSDSSSSSYNSSSSSSSSKSSSSSSTSSYFISSSSSSYSSAPSSSSSSTASSVEAQTNTFAGSDWITPSESVCNRSNGGSYGTYDDIPYCYANWDNAKTICSASGGSLPASTQLQAVYTQCDTDDDGIAEYECRKSAGFADSDFYWCSEEDTKGNAWQVHLFVGGEEWREKLDGNLVRCVR